MHLWTVYYAHSHVTAAQFALEGPPPPPPPPPPLGGFLLYNILLPFLYEARPLPLRGPSPSFTRPLPFLYEAPPLYETPPLPLRGPSYLAPSLQVAELPVYDVDEDHEVSGVEDGAGGLVREHVQCDLEEGIGLTVTCHWVLWGGMGRSNGEGRSVMERGGV